MTNMKRTTISFPDELADRIFNLRKDDRFTKCSYSEIIRVLVEHALDDVHVASDRDNVQDGEKRRRRG